MNAPHTLRRRAALLAATVGLAGTALLGAGGTAYAAPGPDHDWNWEHDGDHHGRHHDRDGHFFEPRHPRQARHWDDGLERCNPSNCWRGVGSYWHYYHDHHGHHGHWGDGGGDD